MVDRLLMTPSLPVEREERSFETDPQRYFYFTIRSLQHVTLEVLATLLNRPLFSILSLNDCCFFLKSALYISLLAGQLSTPLFFNLKYIPI